MVSDPLDTSYQFRREMIEALSDKCCDTKKAKVLRGKNKKVQNLVHRVREGFLDKMNLEQEGRTYTVNIQ